jgi:outer membrane lipoprotein-sorting protein
LHLLILVAAPAPGKAQTPPEFEAVAERARAIQVLDASFEQRKESVLFLEPQTAAGRFTWARPDRVRWSYDGLGTFLSVAGSSWWLDAEGRSRRLDLPMDAGTSSTLLALMSFDGEVLRRSFEIRKLEAEKLGPGLLRLELVPKEGVVLPFVRVQIDVELGTGYASEVRLWERSGDQTQLRFSEHRRDPQLPEGFLAAP